MRTRVFKTRYGRITVTDETFVYEEKGNSQRRVSIARADITKVRLVIHQIWVAGSWTDVIVRHSGGILSISRVGNRTAQRVRKALGF
jgi:hypothetical protein